MSHCLNLRCPKPVNPDKATFCAACGMRLLLGDRFRAFQPIGRGRSSRTFLAVDTRKLVNARCIIKEFERIADGEPFRKEIMRLDPILQHPQIPRLYAYFERSQQVYLVQEFINGRSLQQKLMQVGALDEPEIWQLLQDVLPILQFLHRNRVIHRDIKPANLIQRDAGGQPGALVLVDFGAAKHATRSVLEKTGTVLGSAEYVAPEQLLGKAIFASDLYSLGVTCIHLLTGLPPFELVNPADGSWVWQSVAGAVSEPLAQIINRLLEKNASRRYQSAEDLWEDVQARSPLMPQTRFPSFASLPEIPNLVTAPVTQATWTCQHHWSADSAIKTLAVISDRQIAIGTNSPHIQLCDLETGALRQSLLGHDQSVEAIALSPHGHWLASGSRDRTIGVWEVETGALRHRLTGHSDLITAIAWDAAGKRVVSSSRDRTLKLWDAERGQLLFTFEGHQVPVETLAIGTYPFFISGDAQGVVKIWHLETREMLRSLAKHTAAVSAICIAAIEPKSVQSDPDRLMVISGSWDMNIRLRNLNTGGLYRSLTGHLLPLTAIALSPDGQILATSSHDRTIKLWSLPNGVPIATLTDHAAPVLAIGFTPAGALISGSQDGEIRVWTTSAG